MEKVFLSLVICCIILVGCSLNERCKDIDIEKENYECAVEKCGIDNVQKHNYTNGNTDFNCKDYSKIK